MAAREKLTATVSREELQSLRDLERLTNKQIAERLYISEPTVRKYIGPTPREIVNEAIARGRQKWIENGKKPREKQIQKSPKYTPPYSAKDWQESTTIHKLNGFYANYEVNSTAQEAEITFIDGHPLGKMNKADLMKLIDEFSRVASILER